MLIHIILYPFFFPHAFIDSVSKMFQTAENTNFLHLSWRIRLLFCIYWPYWMNEWQRNKITCKQFITKKNLLLKKRNNGSSISSISIWDYLSVYEYRYHCIRNENYLRRSLRNMHMSNRYACVRCDTLIKKSEKYLPV